jgi:glutamyl-tRNA reductase
MWEGDPEDASALFASMYRGQPMPQGGIVRTNEEAFHHLCRIAAGLESPNLGEPEVMSQVRQAIGRHAESTHPHGLLENALGAAVGVGRRARRHLGATVGGSLATAAGSVAAAHGEVAILGAGAMARATARSLAPATVTMYSRRPEHIDGVETRPWELCPEAFGGAPAVISTIPGPGPNLPEDRIDAALASRKTPLLLAEVGMPPAFDWLRGHPGVSYMGIDEIAGTLPREANAELDEIVERESAAGWARLTAPGVVGEVIAAMVDSADRAVDEEVRRFAGRLPGASDPETVLRQLAHTVARRLLHPSISYVSSSPRAGEVADLLGKAYGVIDE